MEAINGKVILLNGSPHDKGTTYTALAEVAAALEESGIEAKILHVGGDAHRGCIACASCRRSGKCVFDDGLNEIAQEIASADGLVIGSPVYYSSPNGSLLSFLDRLFYAHSKKFPRMMVGASVVAARRGGCTATFDALNKYFTISGMPVASSCYWNMLHGKCADDAKEDLEGLYTMRTLGRNMAFLIKSIKLGKEAIGLPDLGERPYTNFIR